LSAIYHSSTRERAAAVQGGTRSEIRAMGNQFVRAFTSERRYEKMSKAIASVYFP